MADVIVNPGSQARCQDAADGTQAVDAGQDVCTEFYDSIYRAALTLDRTIAEFPNDPKYWAESVQVLHDALHAQDESNMEGWQCQHGTWLVPKTAKNTTRSMQVLRRCPERIVEMIGNISNRADLKEMHSMRPLGISMGFLIKRILMMKACTEVLESQINKNSDVTDIK